MRAGITPIALFQGGADPGSSPADLGAVVWLDFSDATRMFTDNAGTVVVTGDGDRVRRVNAQPGFASGNEEWYAGTGSSPATDTDRPIYRTSVRNGRDALDFDTGTADGILNLRGGNFTTTVTDLDLATVMCIFEMCTTDTTDQKAPYGSTNGNNTQWNIRKSNDTPNPSGFRVQSRDGSGTTSDDSTVSLSAQAGNFFLHVMAINKADTGSKVRCYWNDVEDTNFTHNPTDARMGLPSAMYVGARTPTGSTVDADGWDARVMEFAVFDGVMNSANRTALYTWANNKWSLNGSI